MTKKNISDLTPNAETIAALKESEEGGGEVFHGTTEELLEKILNEEDEAAPR